MAKADGESSRAYYRQGAEQAERIAAVKAREVEKALAACTVRRVGE